MANRFIPLSPILQKLAPGLAGKPTPQIPGEGDLSLEDIQNIGPNIPGSEQAIPGQNVPIPESVNIRNQPLSVTPNQLNDASSAGNQLLNIHDAVGDVFGPDSGLSPLEPGQMPTSPRPLQDIEENFQDFFPENNETAFAGSTPQVDAIFGLSGLNRFKRFANSANLLQRPRF